MKIEEQSVFLDGYKLDEKEKLRMYEKKNKKRRVMLLMIVLGFLVFSFLNIYSASFYSSISKFNKQAYFAQKQMIFIVLGVFVFAVGLGINYSNYKKKKVIIFFMVISTILLGIVAVGNIYKIDSLVPEINGSRRWINLGVYNLQPSEVLKIVYIILLSRVLEICEENKSKSLEIILTSSIIIFSFTVTVFLQKDLGTSLHYIAIAFVMLFVSRLKLKYIFSVVAIAVLVGGYFSYTSYYGEGTQTYRHERIKTYLNGLIKNEYNNNEGYQIKQSLIALGSGGVVGRGFGKGIQKYSYLPEIHTDFILASLGEEWGFFPLLLIITAYYIIVKFSLDTSKIAKDPFGKYLSVGIGGMLLTQVIMNTYVVTGLIPVTGIPLPLLSYGGSSLWTILIILGILNNVNKVSVQEKISQKKD